MIDDEIELCPVCHEPMVNAMRISSQNGTRWVCVDCGSAEEDRRWEEARAEDDWNEG